LEGEGNENGREKNEITKSAITRRHRSMDKPPATKLQLLYDEHRSVGGEGQKVILKITSFFYN